MQCVESDRMLWEAELHDMVEVYEPIIAGWRRSSGLAPLHPTSAAAAVNALALEGSAELMEQGANSLQGQRRS